MQPLLTALLAFVVCGGGTYALLAAQARRRAVQERLMPGLTPAPVAEASPEEPPDEPTWEIKLRRRLRRAGFHVHPREFLALCLVCPLGLGLIGLVLARTPILALVPALIGILIPPLALRAGEDGRRRRFEGQLPDTLMLLVSSLRAGVSLARAAQVVAEEMPRPTSEEFAQTIAEQSLGLPLAAALTRMCERIGSTDLDLIVTAIVTQQQTGGNLAEILSRIADTIRERVRVQGEIETLTAEGKLSGVILVLLPPALALVLALRDPHYFQPLTGSPIGRELIAGALAGQVVGSVLIRRMISLDL